MIMKLLLSTCVLATFLSEAKADLLEGLGHDHSHEHDDDHPHVHEVNTNELLAEIHRFLPHEKVKTLDDDSFEEPFDFGSSSEDPFDDDIISFTVGTGIGTHNTQRVGVPLSLPAVSTVEGTKIDTLSSFSNSLDNTGTQQQVGVPLSIPLVPGDNIVSQHVEDRLSPPPVLVDNAVTNIAAQRQVGVPLSPPVVSIDGSVDHTGGQNFGVTLPVLGISLDTTDNTRGDAPKLPLPLQRDSIDTADRTKGKGRERPNVASVVSVDTVDNTAGREFGVPLPIPGASADAEDPTKDLSFGLPNFSRVGSLNKPPTKEPLGARLSPRRDPIRTNQISRVSGVPRVPEIVDNTLPQRELSPGIPPLARVPNIIGNRVISDESNEEKDLFLHSNIADSFPLEQSNKEFDDVDNFLGGQGRQLNRGEEFESVAPFTLNSDFPFDGNFPRFEVVPPTSFRCDDHQIGGYYADTETECQVFHVCLGGQLLGSFTCPLGTVFNQAVFVCDWWYNVDCSVASDNYHLNARIGVIDSDEDFS